jgi:AcrR family transcriptional regulator
VAESTKRTRLSDRPRLILDAAIEIIGKRGYYGFTIKELAKFCELTVPGVFHHFGTKEALLLAVLKDHERRDYEAVWKGVPLTVPARLSEVSLDGINQLLHATVERNSHQAGILRLFSILRSEAHYPEHPAFEFFHQRNIRALKVVTEMLAGKVASPQEAAINLVSMMAGLEDVWLATDGSFDLVKHWDQAIDKLLGQAEVQKPKELQLQHAAD